MKTQSYKFSVIKTAGLKCCPDTLIQEKRVTIPLHAGCAPLGAQHYFLFWEFEIF